MTTGIRSAHPQRKWRPLAWMILLQVPALAMANTAPIIDDLTASPAMAAPGETVALQLEAHDPDCPGDCSSGCGETIRSDLTNWVSSGGLIISQDDGQSGSPYSASAQWQAPATEGVYSIEVHLADSGTWMCGGRQEATGTVFVQVGTVANNPPVVESVVATPAQLFPGQTSDLSCVASDPDQHALTYLWSTDHGTVDGAGPVAAFSAASPGLATVVCQVTDELGAVAMGSVSVSVSGAHANQTFRRGLVTPHRLSVSAGAEVFVADRGGGGITVLRLEDGAYSYHIARPDVITVAVDWNDDLLVGTTNGARVLDRHGVDRLELDPGIALGEISDVAVDASRRRYAVLYRSSARVIVYDENGAPIGAFGSVGDDAVQLKSPLGLATTPEGNFVVADTGHGRIAVFDLTGNLLLSFGQPGGGVGEFVQLDDIAVDEHGLIFASDRFQDWVQVFRPDGSPQEVIGTYGDALGRFKSPAGVAVAPGFSRLLVASLNTSSVGVFKTSDSPVSDWPTAEASLSTDHIAFGDVAVGSTSPALELVVTNSGSAPLGISEMTAAAPFDLVSSCDDVVEPGVSCTASVTFSPTEGGLQLGQVVITTNVGDFQVALSGFGVVPAQALAVPAALDFPDQEVGTPSVPKAVLLANTGNVPMGIHAIEVSPEFLMKSTCPAELAGGGSCTISISFVPIEIGPRTGRLTVRSTATNGRLEVPLSGQGVIVELTPEPAALDFGEVLLGHSRDLRVTVRNTGSGPAGIHSVEVVGDNPAEFAVDAGTCVGSTLDVGSDCFLEIEFAPTMPNERSAEVRISTDPGGSFFVALSGVGDPDPIFTDGFENGDALAWSGVTHTVETAVGGDVVLTPQEIDFGPLELGAEAPISVLVVTNISGRRLDLGAVAIVDDPQISFFLAGDTCSGSVLGPGDGCRLVIGMRTLDEGPLSAVVRVPTSGTSPEARLKGTVRWP